MRNIKVRIAKLLMLGIAMLMLGTSNVMAQVNVSLPDITRQFGAPDEDIAITVSSLTGLNVFSGSFTITYDKNVLYLTDAIFEGTLIQGVLTSENVDTANGKISVAWAAGDAISGSGTYVKLRAKYRNYGTSALTFTSFSLNEGNPSVTVVDGSVNIPSLAVKFGDVSASVGDTIFIPVTTSELTAANNVVSFEFDATFDPAILSVVGIQTTGTLSSAGLAQYQANNTAGTLAVSWATGEAITGSGDLILIRVAVKAAGTSPLTFTSFMFNEGTPSAGTLAGSLIATDIATYSISGKVTYNNTAGTALQGVIVTLSGADDAVDTTDVSGNYAFTGLVAGTYSVAVSKDNGWGGVNATDALIAQRYFLGTSTLDSLQKLAGDVTNSGDINNTDALDIVRRYVGVIDAFAKADWVFLPSAQEVELTTSSQTVNIGAQATGDINASLIITNPGKAAALSLNEYTSLSILAKETVEIPVRVTSEVLLGAASLQIAYPEDLLQFKGVKSSLSFQSKESDGVVRLAWADLAGAGKNAVQLNANDVLVTLVFTAKAVGHASFSLEANSELADNEGVVVKGSVSAPSVNITSPTAFALKQNYPNPFNPSTTISYTLPETGNVTLTIYNITGQEVAKVINGSQVAGSHEVTWNASNLSSGIYFYKLNFEGAGRSFSDIKSMILLK
jgi:hypothetical protein